MNDTELTRYARHILLDEIGIEGQQRILNAKVLIVGIGGLGSPASLYLAASGVGQLALCDNDLVDLGNLQRQIAHRTATIGLSKVASACLSISEINPETICVEVPLRADAAELDNLVSVADAVLDCSDNFPTRYAINSACVKHAKPLISGSAIRFSGQAALFDLRNSQAACYNCLFPEEGEPEELRCATSGVFSPLTGMIGTIQAAETLKLLAGIGRGLSNRLLAVNALDMSIRQSVFHKDPSCRVCTKR
jgi:adenylyltransferase/sulfurtransferase